MYAYYQLCSILFLKIISTVSSTESEIKNEPENPLILTPLIKSGNTSLARKLAQVHHPDFKGVESYSGYFTVNETCESNLFFWFFPAEKAPESAPVVLYTNGGPGGSSLVCMLAENGPFILLDSGEIVKRDKYSWSEYFNVIYIDHPVNVGFSFTKNKDCMARDERRIGTELYNALVQVFELFPDLQENDFYLSGVSFAGHFIPATAYTIHKKNPSAEVKINLKGLVILSGFIDMRLQNRYSPYLYHLGVVDEDGRQQLEEVENEIQNAIDMKNWDLAKELSAGMMWNYSGDTLFTQLTGLIGYENYAVGDGVTYFPNSDEYFNRKDIRKALHADGMHYTSVSWEVMSYLGADFVQGVMPELIEVLNNGYKVLLFYGQLDIGVAYPMARDLINEIKFNGKSEFQAAKRFIWQVGDDVAGYVREGGLLTFALVRNAGHVVGYDQPKWARELVLGFIHPECVKFEGNRRSLVENCVK